MSIEGKHSYRFVYLKSEKWQNVRIEALAREGGKCQICAEESISNDAHHMWYPENIWETTSDHLVILCRPCHDFIHTMVPECKTSDESVGREAWLKFSNAIVAWRKEKVRLFMDPSGLSFQTPKSLREELARLKLQMEPTRLPPNATEQKAEKLFGEIKKLADCYLNYAKSVKSSIDTSEFQI